MSIEFDDDRMNIIGQNGPIGDHYHYIDLDRTTPLHIELSILKMQAEDLLANLHALNNVPVDQIDYVIQKLMEAVNYLYNTHPR